MRALVEYCKAEARALLEQSIDIVEALVEALIAKGKPRPLGSIVRGQSGVDVPVNWERLGQNPITGLVGNNPWIAI